MSNLTCPRCEKEVSSNWKYCRFCGSKLEIKVVSAEEDKRGMEEIEKEIHVEPPKEKISFDKKLYYDVLSSRAERSIIMKKKSEIRGEISSLLDQLKAGLVGEDHVLPKIKELRVQVQEINEESKKYSDIPDELPVEVLNDEIEAAEKRIRKIEDLKEDENISRESIREAKRKAQSSLELLKEQQSTIFGHLRSWKKDLESNVGEVRKEVEHLYIRYKTEEITEGTYKEKKSQLIKSIQNDEEVIAILKTILQ